MYWITPSILQTAAACAAIPLLVAVTEGAGAASDFPVRPVRMIIPFAPGGGSDIVGRILAHGLSERWGQTVVVDNRPGAGSTIGTALGARAPADGYTVFVSSSAIAFSPALYRQLGYDIRRDFEPLSLLARQPSMLAVAASVPASSVRELIALARSNGGTLSYGSAGVGSATHLGGELFRHTAGIDMTHVPYKSAGLAMTALLGGEIHVLLTNAATVIPHVKSGRVRALATSGRRRTALNPELPTVDESGLPGFEYDTWYAMLAPAGIERSLSERLSADTVKVLGSPRNAERLSGQGIEVIASKPAVLADYLKAEIAKWGQVIKSAGIAAQ